MFVFTPRTLRAVGVDEHCDRGIGYGCRRDFREVLDAVDESLTEVNPHDRPQFAAVQRHQDQ
jgi:hypothetical protein